MTRTELYNAIINRVEITDEMVEVASLELEKSVARNEERAKKNAEKKAEENAPIIESILGYLVGKSDVVASEVANACEISPQKASALLRKLAENGKVIVSEVKAKKGKVKGYTLTETE